MHPSGIRMNSALLIRCESKADSAAGASTKQREARIGAADSDESPAYWRACANSRATRNKKTAKTTQNQEFS